MIMTIVIQFDNSGDRENLEKKNEKKEPLLS